MLCPYSQLPEPEPKLDPDVDLGDDDDALNSIFNPPQVDDSDDDDTTLIDEGPSSDDESSNEVSQIHSKYLNKFPLFQL